MVLLLNEHDKSIRYTDRFSSFTTLLNKLREDKHYHYVDLVKLGLEHRETGQANVLLGYSLCFSIVKKLLDTDIPSILSEDKIPIIELCPFRKILETFSYEDASFLKMMLNTFSFFTIFTCNL